MISVLVVEDDPVAADAHRAYVERVPGFGVAAVVHQGRAVFEIAKLGDVYPKLVPEGGQFHIVRLTGKTDARERSYVEAERSIRVVILQNRLKAAEAELERDLRRRFPVKIDDAALTHVQVPKSNQAPDGSPTEEP